VSKESGERLNQKFHCIANEFDDKDPCNSSDALSIYLKKDEDDNEYYDGYCWSCGQAFDSSHVHNSSHAKELGVEDGEIVDKPKFTFAPKVEALTSEQIATLKDLVGFTDKPYRSISPEVLKFFGHMVKRNNNGVPTEVYYPETEDDKVGGFKIRILPKRFTKVGRTGKSSQLSGQFRYKSAGKRVLIVGGENDKCAAYQALTKYGVHVVSPTTGEGSAAKQCAAQYEWLDQYEEIYLGLDNDDKGKEAIEAVCKVLPANKVKIVRWSDKDPHNLLEDGKDEQIRRDFFNARDYVDNGIKTAAEAMLEVNEFLTAPKITLPPYLHRLEHAMRGGIKSTGAIVNIIGDTSIGKSYFTDNLEQHWFFNSPVVPTIISLERTAGELLTDHYSLHLKKNLSWFKDGDDAIQYLAKPDVKQMCEQLVYAEDGVSRFFIVDERNGTVETLKKQVEVSMKKYGSRMFIFDPLTDWLRSLPLDQQENFMMWQKLMKKEGVVFINVLHTRKPPTDKEGKVRKVSEYDILGSGTFVQSADINIVLNRNKMAECPIEKNTTIVDMPKCRGGSTGEICRLYYDQETRQQYDYDDFFSGARQVNPEYKPEKEEVIDYGTGEILQDDDVVTSNF
jgi:archaellum biogenesis ATPase FlaH/5S rRNA maturation endonuclease (ribonuclease M5)